MEKKVAKDPLGIRNVNFSCFGKTGNSRENLRLWKKQRMERGFDDTECWNLDLTICGFVIPRLEVLKQIHHGYPADIESDEKWCEIVDEMISGFQLVQKKFESFDKWSNEEEQQMQNGLNLFVKYFTNLWD